MYFNKISPRGKHTWHVFFSLWLMFFFQDARSMDFRINVPIVVMSGHVDGNEHRVLAAILDNNPGITTVVLKDSGGGDTQTGLATAQLIRDKGLDTAVSGFCRSSCANIFIGGNRRYFSDDQALEKTLIAFHAEYSSDGKHSYMPGPASSLKSFYKKMDSEVSDVLMSQWLDLQDHKGFIYFFHQQANLLPRTQKVLICRSAEPRSLKQRLEACEKPEQGDALTNGIVTSWEILHVRELEVGAISVGSDGKIIVRYE